MITGAQISEKEIKMRMLASSVCLFVGVVILAIKFYAFNITDSQAIYSDAMESIVNVVTALVGIVVVYYASKPVDRDHPYGHGKVEYFSAAFEGGLVTFAGILVIVEAVKAITKGAELKELDMGLYLSVAAGIMNLLLGIFLKRFGEKTASPALVASGVHVITDFLTSAGVIVGLLLVQWTGNAWIDILVGGLIGAQMIFSGVQLVRNSVSGLLDAEDTELLAKLARLFSKYSGNGIIQIHHTRTIRAGWFHHIDAHAVVPEFWSIEKAHDRLDEFEKHVIAEYDFGGETNFHLDPCRRSYCSVCDLEGCPVRREAFKGRAPIEVSDLQSFTEPNEPKKS